jgi:RNA polymerase sigma-70 factor (ECF subfamily)
MKEIFSDIDDVVLVQRLRQGDINAFDTIYKKYSGRLYNFGLRLLKSETESEELVQAVFLKLWENHKNLNPDLSFKSYIYTIAYNDICKLFRQRNYMKKFIDETAHDPSGIFADLAERIDYKSLLEYVQKIINKLPDKQRIIFLKSREEGKTTKEIALELGLSPGTVDNYISESLKFIRKNISEKDFILFILFASLTVLI